MIDPLIIEQREEMEELLGKITDPLFLKFFDYDSMELLPQKIEVMRMMIDGKPISEIPLFYDVLERYPKDNTKWDY